MSQVVQPHPSQSPALPGGQVRVVLEPDGVDRATEQLGDVIRAQGVAVVMGEHEPMGTLAEPDTVEVTVIEAAALMECSPRWIGP
ncbi:hypothetical protein ACFWFZ_30410 [Streptomyces sp. NPDC060232]|uniref:hypothetical protein n=1 Tax=Streptomyces sp. NPDC060232 TaxID=3347079 RepID=UPI0036480141